MPHLRAQRLLHRRSPRRRSTAAAAWKRATGRSRSGYSLRPSSNSIRRRRAPGGEKRECVSCAAGVPSRFRDGRSDHRTSSRCSAIGRRCWVSMSRDWTSGSWLAAEILKLLQQRQLRRALVVTSAPQSAPSPLSDHGSWLRGDVWPTLERHRRAIAAGSDLRECVIRVGLISAILRGDMEWDAATRCLDLIPPDGIRTLGRRTEGHYLYARFALAFEIGDMRRALRIGESAVAAVSTEPMDELDGRILVALLWKLSHVSGALRRDVEAQRYIDRARSTAIDFADLHGYCNTSVAEVHRFIAVGSLSCALESFLRVLHPPLAFTDAPRPLGVAGEAARAVAVLEATAIASTGRPLGLVDVAHALRYSEQVLDIAASKVMRVPYLDDLSIASPTELRREYERRLGLVAWPRDGSRPRFTPDERRALLDRWGHRCSICGNKIARGQKIHIDHIVFHKWGGVSKRTSRPEFRNFRPLHANCNTARGDRHGLPIPESAFGVLRRRFAGDLLWSICDPIQPPADAR